MALQFSRKKRGIFQRKFRNREIKNKRSFLQAWVREILKKKGKILHAFISICLFRMFQLLCIDVFELYPSIRCNENTTNIEKCLIQVFSLSQKWYCILYNTYIMLKGGVLLCLGWDRFFSSRIRERVFFFKLGTSMVYDLVASVCLCVCGSVCG